LLSRVCSGLSPGLFWVIVTIFCVSGSWIGCSYSGPDTYVRADYDGSYVKRVAVLPFYNTSQVTGASKIVTSVFIAGLVKSGKYEVEFPGNVKDFLVKERVIARSGVDLETIRLMGKRLNVDAVFLGQVEEYVGSREGQEGVVPVISINARLVDATSGKILFMSHHEKTGNDTITVLDFGKVRSIGELVKKVTEEMVVMMP